MNEFNLTFDEQQNASKLEKDLLQRTHDLNMAINMTTDTNAILKTDHDILAKRVLVYEETINMLTTHYNLIHLQLSNKITQDQRIALQKMLDSVDKENYIVAHETINNLMK
jgi:hypothetical protein